MKRSQTDAIQESRSKRPKEDLQASCEGYFYPAQKETSADISYPNGDRFEGEISNGLPLFGRMDYADHRRYSGRFDLELPAMGELCLLDGSVFLGEFKCGLPHNGCIKYANGDYFKGKLEAHDSLIGVMIYANEDVFVGVLCGRLRVYGQLLTHDGRIYVGAFENGLPSPQTNPVCEVPPSCSWRPAYKPVLHGATAVCGALACRLSDQLHVEPYVSNS